MKLSDLSDEDWFKRLSGRRNTQLTRIQELWEYYDNEQPLYHVANILAEQDDRFPALTINWCHKYVRSIDGRSNLEGFRFVGSDDLDDTMQEIMRRNEVDLHQSINNVATLVTGRSYGIVGPSSQGAVITFESPDSMAVEVDPLTGEAIAALKFWTSDVEAGTDDRAVLYLPDNRGGSRLIDFELGKPVNSSRQKWMAGPARRQTSGLIPVVPFLNQPRYGTPRSQLEDLIPLVDAANFVATSLMATVVHHAAPRMLAINVLESQFLNEDGTVNRDAVKAATGSLWIVPAETDDEGVVVDPDAPEPKISQLPASDLRNFHETLSMLARLGAGLCDLTPTDFGFGVSEQGPSADSINASKHERLLGIERFNRQQGGRYERLMRYALAVEGSDPGKKLIESLFRNPATPTKQSMADAAVKTLSTGIADLYQSRKDYGYTTTEIEAMEKRERTLRRDPFRPDEPPEAETEDEPGDVSDDGDDPDAPPAGE